MTPKAAEWLVAAYAQVVDFVGWSFGTERAHMIVGGAVLLVLLAVTLWATVSAFQDISGMITTVLRAAIKVALAVFFGTLMMRFYAFHSPNDEVRDEATRAARAAAEDAHTWFASKWLRSIL